MTPRLLTCHTGWVMVPFNYSRNTGRGPKFQVQPWIHGDDEQAAGTEA